MLMLDTNRGLLFTHFFQLLHFLEWSCTEPSAYSDHAYPGYDPGDVESFDSHVEEDYYGGECYEWSDDGAEDSFEVCLEF